MARNYDPLAEWEDYIPDIYGDDGLRERAKADEGTALTVEIKVLSKRECEGYGARSRRAQRAGQAASDAEARKMMAETVRNVRNYSKDGRKILTGEDLFDFGDQDVCVDVVTAVMNRPELERGLAKKLRSPSASSSLPAKRSADGVAAGATKESPPTTPEIHAPTTPSCGEAT